MRNGILLLVFLVAGCGARTGKGARGDVPEIADSLANGTVLLNVPGAGYRPGDIVRIDTDIAKVAIGDVILFDWRKAAGDQAGFGPTFDIGQVGSLPGKQIAMNTIAKYRGSDGKQRTAWFSTFERCGARSYNDTITIPHGDYLIETERNILIVAQSSIGARVIELVGHDDEAEKEIRQRVY